MRVGIDIRTADPRESGQQRYLWRLGGWLAGQGHAVHFVTVRPQAPEIPLPDGTHLERCDRLTRIELRARIAELELDVLVLNPERSRRYRGIHANVLRSAYGTDHYRQKLRSFRNPVERAARTALRVAPWVLAERRWERAFYEGREARPRVIAQSEYMKRQILATYDVPADRVHVVHNAVNLEEFSPERRAALRAEMRARWNVPDDTLCLLFMGHNFRLKGLWDVLRILSAADRLEAPIHLLVAGRGTGAGQRRKAERLVGRYGLSGRVTLAGAVQPSLHALAAADALLHASWHDSFGFVALEAMAAGLPVVTTRFAGAAELIEDRVSGLLVEPGDEASLLSAIDVVTDENRRESLGAAAAQRASLHDEPTNFRKVLGVLDLAASERSTPIGF